MAGWTASLLRQGANPGREPSGTVGHDFEALIVPRHSKPWWVFTGIFIHCQLFVDRFASHSRITVIDVEIMESGCSKLALAICLTP